MGAMSKSDVIIDLTKVRKTGVAENKCSKHQWREYNEKGNWHERCTICRERFPCLDNECEHFDCAEVQMEQGKRTRFPNHPGCIYSNAITGEILYDGTTDDE